MNYADLEASINGSRSGKTIQPLGGSWGESELLFYKTENGIGAKTRTAEMVPALVKHAFDHEQDPISYIATWLCPPKETA